MNIKSSLFRIWGRSFSEEEHSLIFDETYELYSSYVRKTVYYMVGETDVDDVVQEVFVKVWKALPRFRGESQLKTWIYRISINVSLSHLRKSKKYLNDEELDPRLLAQEPSVGDPLMEKLIEKGVSSLNDKHKVVFVLYYKQELSVEEIALILKIPQGTVKSRLHKSRKSFINHLKSYGVSYEE